MERKIGETFEIDGQTYVVVEDNPKKMNCDSCGVNFDCPQIREITGLCLKSERSDGKGVHFVKMKN